MKNFDRKNALVTVKNIIKTKNMQRKMSSRQRYNFASYTKNL